MNPKVKFLGFLIALFTTLLAIALFSTDKKGSSLTLEPSENKFKVSFNIQDKDKEELSKFLEHLLLPQKVAEGITFELDATSSAKLALASPSKADLEFSTNTVNFAGTIDNKNKIEEFDTLPLKVPKTTNLIVASADFNQYLDNINVFPKELQTWIEANASSPQYLVVFSEESDIALVFPKYDFDLESFKNLKFEGGESSYKLESQEDVDLHLLKVPASDFFDERVVALFEKGELIYLVSTRQAAQEILKAASGEAIDFPYGQQKISFAVVFLNTNDNPIGKNFKNVLPLQSGAKTKEQVASILAKITELSFALYHDRFSGLMNLK